MHDPENRPVRFEATVTGRDKVRLERAVADLDLDRIPDPQDAVRVLISAAEAEQLLARGCEVMLVAAHPIRPLEKSLVMDDEAANRWLEDQTRGLDRREEK
jgi:hypothetical protein